MNTNNKLKFKIIQIILQENFVWGSQSPQDWKKMIVLLSSTGIWSFTSSHIATAY